MSDRHTFIQNAHKTSLHKKVGGVSLMDELKYEGVEIGDPVPGVGTSLKNLLDAGMVGLYGNAIIRKRAAKLLSIA